MNKIQITADIVEGFTTAFMQKGFDGNFRSPAFHKELWELFTSADRKVAIAAPRGHAKSTTITHTCSIASCLFGASKYVVIVGSTFEEASQFVQNIKAELEENEDLHEVFGTPKFERDTLDDIIVRMGDAYFRIRAKGSGQKVRGMKWGSKRPDLIVVDDLEDDEQVMNAERREKLRTWFVNALLPMGSYDVKVRVVGTILHFDSLLERLLNDPTWKSRRYRAHKDFDDFSEILWEERFTEEELRSIRGSFIAQGNPEGYAQEMLNYPISAENAYFNKGDFLVSPDGVQNGNLIYYAAADLAISQKDKANPTAIVVGGLDEMGFFHVVDVRKGRWDSEEIIRELFSVHKRYKPEMFGIERTHVAQTIGPFLNKRMRETGVYLNIVDLQPIGDKSSRARNMQAMMRTGVVHFDKSAEWYGALEEEMLRFPKGANDDQVDCMAYLGIMVNEMERPETREELDEIDFFLSKKNDRIGRNRVTGY